MAVSHHDRPNTGNGRYAQVGKRQNSGPLSYDNIDSALLRDTVGNVTAAGDMIAFTLTSDRGAFCVIVVHDGITEKWYPNGTESCEDVLRDIFDSNTTRDPARA